METPDRHYRAHHSHIQASCLGSVRRAIQSLHSEFLGAGCAQRCCFSSRQKLIPTADTTYHHRVFGRAPPLEPCRCAAGGGGGGSRSTARQGRFSTHACTTHPRFLEEGLSKTSSDGLRYTVPRNCCVAGEMMCVPWASLSLSTHACSSSASGEKCRSIDRE